MELTDKEIHLLARLSRDRGLSAECKGGDLDALQKCGLILWFDVRSTLNATAGEARSRSIRHHLPARDRPEKRLTLSARLQPPNVVFAPLHFSSPAPLPPWRDRNRARIEPSRLQS